MDGCLRVIFINYYHLTKNWAKQENHFVAIRPLLTFMNIGYCDIFRKIGTNYRSSIIGVDLYN